MEEILLERGRVVFVKFGPLVGKLAVVVEIVNGKKVVVSGPGLGVSRQVLSNKRLELTKYKLKIAEDVTEGDLKKAIESFELVKKWESSGKGKKIQK